MLIVAKITQSAAGGYADYLDAKRQPAALGDYYLKDGERIEAPGRWASGAETFALDPTAVVTGEQLRALMAVRRPDTGGALRRAGGSGEAVAAIDATFSAPKSVSAVWALAGADLREQIEAAHETAIDRALNYATRHVPMLRRRVAPDTVIHHKPAGLIATSWRHTTARAVEDQVPDPQLHSHVLLHGAVRRDGQVVAIDSRAWLVHQRELGAAYRSELARGLAQLGFTVRRGTGRGGRYFELDGVPEVLIDRWSSRHHQVQAAIQARLTDQQHELTATLADGGPGAADALRQLQALHRNGQLSPKQERLTGAATRSAKLPVTAKDLDGAWQQTAASLHFPRGQIERLRRPEGHALQPAEADDVLTGLTEFDATFPARDARAVALERSAGAPIDTALDQLQSLRTTGEILVLADGTGTTRTQRGRERTVVTLAQRLADDALTPLAPDAGRHQADRLDRELATHGGQLSTEQRAAIHLACGPHPLVVIEGQAGTGKSTVLTGIARAHQAAGQRIIVTSTAALAAERLAGELHTGGVQCQAYSTTALAHAIQHERLTLGPHTTIIHDEAALASTHEQHNLLQAVQASGARLIAVGDPEQNPPVGAGGLWPHIEAAAANADAHVELTHNQRARDPADRRDQALFRHGHIERSIRGYAARDHIHFHNDPRRAEDHALDAAHTDRTEGKNTIVIAQTSNDHLDALNARAQAIRHQHGQLGNDTLPLPGRPYPLRAGDEIQIRHTITHPDYGPLRNGTAAYVLNVDTNHHAVRLRLADDTELSLNEQQIADADLRLAYVQHPFPAQGRTTDTAHVIAAAHATRPGTYVALTRARHSTDTYIGDATTLGGDQQDRLQQLAGHLGRTDPDAPSIHTPLATAGLTHNRESTRQRIPVAIAVQDVPSGRAEQPMALTEPLPRRMALRRPGPEPSPDHVTTTPSRDWPAIPDRTVHRDNDEIETNRHSVGFEP